MERKTIGSFIAVLRKANGLTQKDLAEKLNVSDKSVSRWERDDGAPDLSLVPVIAEIFNVTCDELLRGERQAAAQQSEQQGSDKAYPKTEKQRQRILSASLSKYRNRSLIAAGLAIAGFLAAMLCNFGFHRAYIGFLTGAVFYLAAVICQAIFINSAFLSVSDDEMAGAEVERFRHCVVSLGEKAISLSVVLLALSLPLMVFPTDTYMGLTAKSWLISALLFGLMGIVLCGVVCRYIERNQSVFGLRYGHLNGELLPITVFTQQDFMAAQRTIALRNTMFGGVYLLEIAALLFVYFKKRTHAV